MASRSWTQTSMWMSLLTVMVFILATETYADWPPPPPWTQKARMARYLIHNAKWTIVSSLSPEYGNTPFGTLQSYADGPLANSTGVPFFYIASISDTGHNLAANNSAAMTVSQAEGDYCNDNSLDPEEPTCARVTLVGKVVPVNQSEIAFAKNALFSRHPAMKDWPTGHDWQFYKMNLRAVHLLDFYGGATHVHLKDYFSATPSQYSETNNYNVL